MRKKLDEVEDTNALSETRAALEAEREGAAQLERALAAALADNAMLATRDAMENATDTTDIQPSQTPQSSKTTNITSALDTFLAE